MPSATTLYRGVFLPTDYSEAGEWAFYQALAFALAGRVPLRLLHVNTGRENPSWDRFPGVRETITRWKGKGELVSSDFLKELGLAVRKSVHRGQDPTRVILEGLERRTGQLLVMAPRSHDGLTGFFHRSLSGELIRKTKTPTLFVPEGCRSLVGSETGVFRLNRILFPIDHQPSPNAILSFVDELTELLDLDRVEGTLLHIGKETVDPRVPRRQRWQWSRLVLEGDPTNVIHHTAERGEYDLIAMTTEGRQGLGDLLRGSTTERIIKDAPCPVLVVHAP